MLKNIKTFLVSFIDTQKSYSDEAFSKVANIIAKDLGIEKIFKTKDEISSYWKRFNGEELVNLTYREIRKLNL